MAPIPQHLQRAALLQANRAVIQRVRDAVSTLSPSDLMRQPPGGGWSVSQVLEHLIVSADSYLETLRPIVAAKNGHAVTPETMWKPSLMGGLLVNAFRSPRKRRAPKIYRPGPSPRSGALEEFVARHEELGRLIAAAGDKEWRRVRLRSPVTALIRMNLGDAFAVLVTHAERHAGQIERTSR
ncbi:MAG TPA: DinB family protein [Gemmatimonadaceae bacterium]|nr:DinB family protein [Gemmatimonadaceae bacterium]